MKQDNEPQKLVKEAIDRVLSKRKDMLIEIKNRPPRRNYQDLSKPGPPRTHNPVYVNREYISGEFEDYSNNLNEDNIKEYPETLDTGYTIESIKQTVSEYFNNFHIESFSCNNGTVIIVSMDDDVEFRLYEQPLIILDDLFNECGYFRNTPDKIYIGSNNKKRIIQYISYHSSK